MQRYNKYQFTKFGLWNSTEIYCISDVKNDNKSIFSCQSEKCRDANFDAFNLDDTINPEPNHDHLHLGLAWLDGG